MISLIRSARLIGQRYTLLALLLFGLAGCGRQADAQTISIRDIQTQPPGTSVALRGTAQTLAPLLGGTVYELQDGTGSVWVLTRQTPPTPGQEITVQGTLRRQALPYSGFETQSLYIEQP